VDWHRRFIQQAEWTRELRQYLFQRARLAVARHVLEVGCGTGAILVELRTAAALHGLDLSLPDLKQAGFHTGAILTCGEAYALPYPSQTFDITFCHFLLLWLKDPLATLQDMARVTRAGGHVLALAEPDYSGRIDRPKELASLGRWQAESLRRQGADPDLGRRLAGLFTEAGIEVIETGSLGGRERRPLTPEEREMEWAVLEADLAGMVTDEDIQRMKKIDEQAWRRGERVLHVPTHFAWGRAG